MRKEGVGGRGAREGCAESGCAERGYAYYLPCTEPCKPREDGECVVGALNISCSTAAVQRLNEGVQGLATTCTFGKHIHVWWVCSW
jgi:hypothetical protein